MLMLVIGFLQWWYGPGWRDMGHRVLGRAGSFARHFSLPILLRTMFQPWRRIMTPSGGSLQQRVQAMLDNLVSRWVGFSIRLLSLIAAVILMVATTIIGGLLFLLWPALPVISLGLMAAGLVISVGSIGS
jgi:hypothetical protein